VTCLAAGREHLPLAYGVGMSDAVKPPDEVFCMDCGPGTIMEADPRAQRLRCLRCGAESWLPALPLFVVTGASGTGKSTITEPLRSLLPGCQVFETDVMRFSSIEAQIIEHQRFASWLRARITPSFDTSTASPAEVADRIAAWVQALLPATEASAASGSVAEGGRAAAVDRHD
jgi:ribosomal protein S27AE